MTPIFRVGYEQLEKDAKNAARRLTEFYVSHSYQQIAAGETLVVIGWDWETYDAYEWARWVIRGQENRWHPA